MIYQLRCPIRNLLQEQASDSAHAYAKAMLEMLQAPDVIGEQYREASKRALRAQAELNYLKHEIEAHYPEHQRNSQAAGRGWKKLSFCRRAISTN